ncbi:MAG TPA: YdcH family protein [Nitrospirae bacterium]|nr:YdcH family protein [Nitrospirota bacterium]
MLEQEIVEILKQQNEEFKKLALEHRELDTRLSEITKKPYLTPEEEVEKKRMQKEKLMKKDKMADLIREYKKNHS